MAASKRRSTHARRPGGSRPMDEASHRMTKHRKRVAIAPKDAGL
jgi:hypothetical protein